MTEKGGGGGGGCAKMEQEIGQTSLLPELEYICIYGEHFCRERRRRWHNIYVVAEIIKFFGVYIHKYIYKCICRGENFISRLRANYLILDKTYTE